MVIPVLTLTNKNLERRLEMTKRDQFLAKAVKVANIILAGGGVVSILVLSYFIYHYGWAGDRKLTTPMGILVYYILPALLASFLFAALKLKSAYKINFSIVCLSLVVSVYGSELFLHLTNSTPFGSAIPIMNILRESNEKEKLAAKLAKHYGVEVDTRDVLEVITDLHGRGIDAVPSVIPRFQLRYYKEDNSKFSGNIKASQIIALGGISNKVTVLCNESGSYITYDSDKHGFRNPEGIWESGHIDIAAVGDSFTQGYCVPADKNFVDLIRQHYPGTLNLGMAGEGPLLMLATLKEYLLPFKPKLVLWFYFEGNDLVDLQDEKQSRLLNYYLEDSFIQGLLERQSEVDQTLLAFIENQRAQREREQHDSRVVHKLLAFIKLAAFRQKLGLIEGISTEELESVGGPGMDLLREILSQAKTRVSSWGGTLYFIYLPNWTRYDNRLVGVENQRRAENQRAQVLTLVRDLGIPIIDILPVFQAQSDPMSLFPFHGPGHYTEKGHRLVAEEVLKAISLSNFVASNHSGSN